MLLFYFSGGSLTRPMNSSQYLQHLKLKCTTSVLLVFRGGQLYRVHHVHLDTTVYMVTQIVVSVLKEHSVPVVLVSVLHVTMDSSLIM